MNLEKTQTEKNKINKLLHQPTSSVAFLKSFPILTSLSCVNEIQPVNPRDSFPLQFTDLKFSLYAESKTVLYRCTLCFCIVYKSFGPISRFFLRLERDAKRMGPKLANAGSEQTVFGLPGRGCFDVGFRLFMKEKKRIKHYLVKFLCSDPLSVYEFLCL